MVMVFGVEYDWLSIIFDVAVVIIASVLAYFIAKWAKAKRRKSRISTTFANLDPKTGLCKMRDIPDYNERPAAIRWEDEKGRVNRRNTTGHPTFQMDFTASAGGGIERMYVASSASRTCQSTEALCGEKQDDDLTNIADKTISLWDEQNASMDVGPPKFAQIWWQIVLGLLAGCGIGVVLLTVWLSRQPVPHDVNATTTQAAMLVRMAIGK